MERPRESGPKRRFHREIVIPALLALATAAGGEEGREGGEGVDGRSAVADDFRSRMCVCGMYASATDAVQWWGSRRGVFLQWRPIYWERNHRGRTDSAGPQIPPGEAGDTSYFSYISYCGVSKLKGRISNDEKPDADARANRDDEGGYATRLTRALYMIKHRAYSLTSRPTAFRRNAKGTALLRVWICR